MTMIMAMTTLALVPRAVSSTMTCWGMVWWMSSQPKKPATAMMNMIRMVNTIVSQPMRGKSDSLISL